MEKSEDDKVIKGVFVLILMLSSSMGVGFILGAGWGFLIFAVWIALILFTQKKKEIEE